MIAHNCKFVLKLKRNQTTNQVILRYYNGINSDVM